MAQRGFFSVLGGIVGLLGCCVAVALLLAAMITPGVAMTAAADNAISAFNELPDKIALGKLAQQNRIFAQRDGKPVQIATLYDQNRQEVSWNEVSPYLKEAAVAGEDRRFFEHGGVDLTAIFRAAMGNFTNRQTISGASTIDMQLVKNILIQEALQIENPDARNRAYKAAIIDTVDRKLREAKLAIALDKRYTKNEILLGYLNITGFGGQTYGVQSAARQYFSVDAKDVTVAQAASLMAIVQQPNVQNLSDPKFYPANKVRRDQILGDMFEMKYINRKQYENALATKIEDMVKLNPPASGCLYAKDAKFACDYARRLVPTLEALGNSPAEREANWARGGYELYTSIDLKQQDVAQASIDKNAPATEKRFKLGSAGVAVQPRTGRILLMAQNKHFDNSANGNPATTTAVNFNTDRDYGGSSGFQTGSAYKIFTLINWLQTGHKLYDVVDGTPRPFPMSSFRVSCGGFVGAPYNPPNDAAWERGRMTVLDATRNSVNVAFLTMAQQLDLCAIRSVATSMGVHRADGQRLNVFPSSVLGTNEVAPLSMAAAIATIGADGIYCVPRIIDKVVGPNGQDLPGQPKDCKRAISTDISRTVAYALGVVMDRGTGAPGNPRDGVPLVGKTGTADESHQNWLVGTTTKVSLSLWVGNISGGQSLRKIDVAGTNGYNTKFNIFRATMASLDKNRAYRGGKFGAPDPSLMYRYRAPVPRIAPPRESPQRPVPAPTPPPTATPTPPQLPTPPKPPKPPKLPGKP